MTRGTHSNPELPGWERTSTVTSGEDDSPESPDEEPGDSVVSNHDEPTRTLSLNTRVVHS